MIDRWNPSEITLDDIFRCNLFSLQQLASDPEIHRNGIDIIVDFQGHGLHHVRQLTPSYAKKFASLFVVCAIMSTNVRFCFSYLFDFNPHLDVIIGCFPVKDQFCRFDQPKLDRWTTFDDYKSLPPE